jgi:hypothetical protein
LGLGVILASIAEALSDKVSGLQLIGMALGGACWEGYPW